MIEQPELSATARKHLAAEDPAALRDPQAVLATVLAVVAVTFLWFALVLSVMWLAAQLGANSGSPRHLVLALAFAVAATGLFAHAVSMGGPPRRPIYGAAALGATIWSIVCFGWLGAILGLRWIVVPVSYGVGAYVTRYYRELPPSVAQVVDNQTR